MNTKPHKGITAMKPFMTLCLFAVASISQAALQVNMGRTDAAAAGQGPEGANAAYLFYGTPNESATSGQISTFTGISFAEGGLGGTYSVGLALTWLDETSDATKQAFIRPNDNSYPEFWETWVGVDTRTTSGGIGGGDRLRLSLSGLEANQQFVFTSYHADTSNQSATFTVDQTPTATETSTSPFAFARLDQNASLTPWTTNAYSFDVTSDGSGNLDITYAVQTGSFFGVNGFDLVAIPEPSTLLLLFVAGIPVVVTGLRRRC